VNFTGGGIGASFGTGTPRARAQEFLQQVDPVLPGIDSRWNGKATIDFWPGNPYTRGSYSHYSVGQYTEFGGIEGEQEGKCHFAGEHTSIDSQGISQWGCRNRGAGREGNLIRPVGSSLGGAVGAAPQSEGF
jgi:monoamine oxidase